MDPLSTFLAPRPQSEKADERQVPNSAGGYTFLVDETQRLRRFLILGTAGGTFYAGERELTAQNCEFVIDLAKRSPLFLLRELVEVSLAGRAPKQQPTLFALAAVLSYGDDNAKAGASAVFNDVVRTGTHLFTIVGYLDKMRGWGRGLRRTVGGWYTEREVDRLAYQVVKYRQRDGWTHRDVLRLSHPKPQSPEREAVFDWACGRVELDHNSPAILHAYDNVQVDAPAMWAVREAALSELPWEAFPDAALNDPQVWDALIHRGLPQTALIRQLPRLTRLGVLKAADTRARVCQQLVNPEILRKARVHPLSILVAARTYASGASVRGQSTWAPDPKVIDALDAAFYAAFGAVEAAGKRTMLALDVSGSMGYEMIAGMPITPREASAALAMVTAAVEPDTHIVGFTSGQRGFGQWGRFGSGSNPLTPLAISPRQRLDDVVRAVSDLNFGATDCSLPMAYAIKHNLEIDTFVIYTDSETWSGKVHPHVALKAYRRHSGIDARLVVVGMTATEFTIADPSDPGMMDVVGFDTGTPAAITAFSRGA